MKLINLGKAARAYSFVWFFCMIHATQALASGFWGCAKDYSGAVGLAVGAGTLVGSVAQKTVGLTPAGKAVAIGVAGGTAIGEGIDWIISRWWDPLDIMYSIYPPGSIVTAITDAEIDAMIPQIMDSLLPGNNLTINDILGANAFGPGLGDTTLLFLRTAIRACIYALQGPAAYHAYGGANHESRVACAALTDQLHDFDSIIQKLGSKLSTAKVPYQSDSLPLVGSTGVLANLTKTQYEQWLSNLALYGATWLPKGEKAVMQRLFDKAGTYFSGTISNGLVGFLTDGGCLLADTVFQDYGENLTFSTVILSGNDTRWSRIDLSESPVGCTVMTPFLSEYGLFVLALLVLVAGVYHLLSRRESFDTSA